MPSRRPSLHHSEAFLEDLASRRRCESTYLPTGALSLPASAEAKWASTAGRTETKEFVDQARVDLGLRIVDSYGSLYDVDDDHLLLLSQVRAVLDLTRTTAPPSKGFESLVSRMRESVEPRGNFCLSTWPIAMKTYTRRADLTRKQDNDMRMRYYLEWLTHGSPRMTPLKR